MITQIAAVLSTYATRRWMMIALGCGALLLTFALLGASFTTRRPIEPMMVMQLIALPTMLVLSFLIQHAKWQFVHSRARLMPMFGEIHLLVLITLLVLALVAYPIVASQLLDVSLLGIMAFVMLMGGTVAWAIHTMRPLFVLAYMALFFSFLMPSVSPLWTTVNPGFDGLRWGLLAAGCVAVGLWLRRLTRMTEEAEDFVIPVQGNFGGSRMEKSEARRVAVLALSRARVQGWFADRWHDRLATLAPPDDARRPQLLNYGFAPVSAPVRALFFIFMALTIGLFQAIFLSRLDLSDPNRGLSAARYGGIATVGMLAFMAPVIISQLLAARMPRLGQELLLPMSRRTLVSGLMRTLGREMAMFAVLGAILMIGAAFVLSPELATPTNIVAALLALVSVQPALFGICFAAALIRSAIARLMLIVFLLYAVLGFGAGIFALGRYVSLAGAGAVALVLVLGGLGLTWVARSMWMRAELGR